MKVGDPRAVLRLVTRLNVGGPARQALLLTRDLAAEYPTTLAAGIPGPAEGELTDPEVRVRRVPLTRPMRPVTDARAIAAVRRLVDSERPAILHTHMAKAGAVGRIAARSLGNRRPRTVHTFHGHVLSGYFSRTVERGFVELERRLARVTDVLVAVSPEVRDSLLDLGIGRTSQFHVVPLGLDLAPFFAVSGRSGALRAHLGVDATTPLVGAVGRLVPIKCLDVLIDAVATIDGAHLVLVGDGEERDRLARHAQQRGMAGRFHVTGWWPDVAAALADLDVVALTSANEGTPVALIEAQAAGRPIVATDVGGVRHVVTDGVSGLLVPAGAADAIAGAVRRVLDDGTLAARLGQGGRVSAERFGSARLVSDVRALYEGLT